MSDQDPRSHDSAIREAVDEYVSRSMPAEDFSRVRPFVKECVDQLDHKSRETAKSAVAILSDFVNWSLAVGVPLERDALFNHRQVERYVEVGLASATDVKLRTYRPKLRSYARQLCPKLWPPPPARQARPSAKTPYTRVEVADLMRLVEHQDDHTQSRRLLALLCLGFGAGLMPGEHQQITSRHVSTTIDGLVSIEVPGRNARPVPVLQPFGQQLLDIAELTPDKYLLGGSESPKARSRRVELLLKSVRGGAGVPRIEIGRMRSTWLAHHLDAIGFPALLKGAGIRQSTGLFDLLTFLPEPDPARVDELLRGSW